MDTIKQLIDKFNLISKKSLGQNFILDENITDKIVKLSDIKNQFVLEIGPGPGCLTRSLIKGGAKKIIAIEKDLKCIEIINYQKKIFSNKIRLIEGDFLNDYIFKKVLKEIGKCKKKIIIVSNLPYKTSIPILVKILKNRAFFKKLILMFQKEVADRIIAKTKTKTFGRLSVLCNWRLEVKKHFDVSKNCFLPKPNVDSTVLSFKPKKKYGYNIKNPKNLEIVTRILFSNRRKMINKNFKKLFKSKNSIAKDLDLNLRLRPEELSCDMFYKIAMIYENLLN